MQHRSVAYRLPREHGAYVVLIVSWLLGVILSGSTDATGAALSLSVALSSFLVQDPFRQFVRPGGTARAFANTAVISLGIIGAVSGIGMISRTPATAACALPLSIIGAVYFAMVKRRSSTIMRSFVGFAGLTLVTPMTMLASNPATTFPNALVAWAFATLFFCTSVFCVSIRLNERGAETRAAVYHISAGALVLVLTQVTSLPMSALVAMAIPSMRLGAILLFSDRYRRLPLKQVGLQESVVALAALILIALMR